MTTEKQKFVTDVLMDLARDTTMESRVRLEAANSLSYLDEQPTTSRSKWYDVKLSNLTMFFLKCVLAAAPSALLLVFIYIFTAIFTQVVPKLLGL